MWQKAKTTGELSSYVFWISASVLFGVLISFFITKTARLSYNYILNQKTAPPYENSKEIAGAYASIVPQKAKLEDLSLVFVGDIMLDRQVEKIVRENFNGDFSALFKNTEFIKNAGIAFGNLEGPVSDEGKDIGNLFSFRMQPTIIEALNKAGFDILSVANNHAGDWGQYAFEQTIFRLKNENIIPTGGGLDITEASSPDILEKENVKFGFLAFSDVGPNWLAASSGKPGILITNESFGKIIKMASEKTDILAVSLHFGEEYQTQHNQRQEELSHLAIDNGAKLVIGHHPHVIQDTEIYKNGFIAYSLGNFIFDQNFSEETMTGIAIEIMFSRSTKEIKSISKKIFKINEFFQPVLEK